MLRRLDNHSRLHPFRATAQAFFSSMVRHAAFTEEKPVDIQYDGQNTSRTGQENSSLAPTGTRTTDPEKNSLSGLTHQVENARAVRKLLFKLGK